MKFSTRLSLAMVALVGFTATIFGMSSYRTIEAALVPAALERLAAQTRLFKAEIGGQLQGVQADVISFRSGPAPGSIVRTSLNGGVDPIGGVPEIEWHNRFAARLIPIIAGKPAYHQFRVAGLADGGREILRIDRTADYDARLVADSEKLRIGDTDYFRGAINLPLGALYFSPITLTQPDGGDPVRLLMHIATPLRSADGKPFGIFAASIDVNTLLAGLRSGAPAGTKIYAVDDNGRYLVHPDRSRELTSAGRAPDAFRDFPDLLGAIKIDDGIARVISDSQGERFGAAVTPVRLAGGSRIAIIETAPYSTITALAQDIQQTSLLVGLVAAFCAVALAMLMARSLSEPLAKVTAAVIEFGKTGKMAVNISAGGEVGVLSRAFEAMANEIKASAIKLRDYALRERFYIAAVESSSYAFITADPDGYITAWNPGAESLFGYTADEAIGQHMVAIVPDDKLEEHRRNRAKITRLERVRNCKTVRLAKGGRRVDVVIDGAPIRSKSGTLRGSSVIARDVTSEKLAQDMFRMAVEASPNGVIMIDLHGKIVMANAETERLFGYERGELLHKSIDLLVPDGARHQHIRHRQDFAANPQSRRMGAGRNLFGRRKDGTEFPVEVGLNPISTRDGTLILSAIVDISERRRNERLKDEFVSTVSHELRTPLTSIAGSLGLLTGGATGQMAEPTMRLLKIAHKNSERLVRLINDILDIEKMESGKIVFDLTRVDVPALAEQAIEANRGFAEKYGVRLRLDPSATSVSVRADPDRLMQVLTNLLSNAIKFSPEGEEVLLNIQRRTDKVRITVGDRGPGIPEEFKARIFEKFAQADASDARQKGGTGLGLSIVKQIATLLGGTVGFDSATRVGTTFYVDLPSWEIATGTSAPGVGAGEDPRRLQLLVVDDDAGVANLISGRLAMSGFNADIALGADDALRQARAKHYDAIAVDLSLPDRDGISLIQDLRSQPQYQNTPIVVISADAASGRDDVRSSSLNVLDWLNKPIDTAHLTSVIERPIARNGSKHPRVLHVDDDESILGIVAAAVAQTCAVTSVSSIDEARRALSSEHFDLVVLDLLLSQASGLDLLPELRGREGNAIPVILYSARAANVANAAQVCAALTKSQNSIDHLVLTLRQHVAARPMPAQQNREVA